MASNTHGFDREVQRAFFAPDVRCKGWMITEIEAFFSKITKKNETVELSRTACGKIMNKLMTHYRMYINGRRQIFISTPATHLDQLCDALYSFVLKIPVENAYRKLKPGLEYNPALDDFDRLFSDYVRTTNSIRAKASINSRDREEIIERNFTFELANRLARKIIVDLPVQPNRDLVLLNLLHINIINVPKRDLGAWVEFNNFGYLLSEIDKLSPRKNKDSVFSRYYPATKTQFNKFNSQMLQKSNMDCEEVREGLNILNARWVKSERHKPFSDPKEKKRGTLVGSSIDHSHNDKTATTATREEGTIEISFKDSIITSKKVTCCFKKPI